MATFAFNDATIWIGEHDASCDTNQVSLQITFDDLDDTTFCDDYRSRLGGLGSATMQVSGFTSYDTDQIDPALFSNLGANVPVGLTAEGDTEGNITYFFQSLQTDMQQGAQVGAVHEISATIMNSGQSTPVVRGEVFAPKAARSSSSNSAGSQLGAVSATQSLYSVVHVFSTTGSPTLDVIVESDDNGSFTSATTQITHTQFTAAGSEFSSQAGAISDDYYRAAWTFGGTGTITFGVLVGIA